MSEPFGKNAGELSVKAFDLGTGGGGPSYRAMLRLSGEAQLTKPFLQNPFVHACVMAISRAFATVPLRLYRRDANDNAQDAVVRDHWLLSLLERPNPLLSQKKLWRTQAVYHSLYGEVFWILLRRVTSKGRVTFRPINAGERPDEIWPVRGDLMEPVIDENTKMPVAWRIATAASSWIDYPDHAVAQFAEVNPYNPLRGVGPMQAAFRPAQKDFTIDRYDDALLKNGGSPGGVLSSTQPLTEQQLSVVGNAWNEGFGRTESTRKTAVVPFGMEYKQFGFSPSDMEFKDLRMWNRETVMSVFGVTRPILGLTEGLNYASAREAFRVFWEVTVCPLLEFHADEFNSKVLAKFEPPGSMIYAAFDTSNVASLRETIDSKIDRTMKLFQQCGRSFDEAARLAGWQIPPTQMGDRMFVPASMAPLPEEKAMYDAQVAAARAASSEPSGEPSDDDSSEDDSDEKQVARAGVKEGGSEPEGAARALSARSVFIDEHAPKIAKRAKRVARDYLLATRAKLRSIAGAQTQVGSLQEKMILTEEEVERLLEQNAQSWAQEMADALRSPLFNAWDAAATAAFTQFASDGIFMSSTNPVALEYLNTHLVQLSEGTTSTLATQVRRTIIKVLASAPDSVVRLDDAIRETLRELEDQVEVMIDALEDRAVLIARTEAAGMASAASSLQWRELGIETHTWLTSQDERVRHSHQSLDGKTVRIGDIFGFNLRWPGDPQADAGEVVNCRCTTIAEPNP